MENRFQEEFYRLQEQDPFRSTAETVYNVLSNFIVSGELPNGTVLRQSDLADHFGLSRTPVRDALIRLTDEGFIEKFGKSSLRVYPFNSLDYLELVRFRSLLETAAVHDAAYNLNDELIDMLKNTLNDYKTASIANNKSAALAADDLFHLTIINASKNKYIIDTYCHYLRKIHFYRNILSANQNWKSTYRFHKKIYESLLSRNVDAAEEYIKQHLDVSKKVSDSTQKQ